MSYYKQNVVTEDMLKQIVNDERNKQIEKISAAIMKHYDENPDKDDDIEDDVLDRMYHDRNVLEELETPMPEWREMLGNEQKIWIHKLIDAGLFKPGHGDGFHWLGDGYRNEGLWFWHKEKGLIYPYTKIDDYGSVPPDFLVGNGEDQFAPYHWKDIVDHNSIVFLAPDIKQTIKETAKCVIQKNEYTGKMSTSWHTSIVIKGRVYAVQIDMETISHINNIFSYEEGRLYKHY